MLKILNKILYPCNSIKYFLHWLTWFLAVEGLVWGHLYIYTRNVEHFHISLMATLGAWACLQHVFRKKE